MSQTRILCNECGHPLYYCICKKPLSSDAVLGDVKSITSDDFQYDQDEPDMIKYLKTKK